MMVEFSEQWAYRQANRNFKKPLVKLGIKLVIAILRQQNQY
jgi:hypothetical protein